MGFELKKSTGNFKLCPAGTFVARCFMVIDMGHHDESYQGRHIGLRPKVRFGFELPTKLDVFKENGPQEPYTLSIKFTNSLHEKGKLLPTLNQWRGKPLTDADIARFTIDKVLGKEAMITVVHKEKADKSKTAVISTITQLMEGVTCPPPIMTPILFTVDWKRDHEAFKTLPEWCQEEISACDEWKPKSPAEAAAEAATADAGPADSGDGW